MNNLKIRKHDMSLILFLMILFGCSQSSPVSAESFSPGEEPASYTDATAYTRPAFTSDNVYDSEAEIDAAADSGTAGEVVVIADGTYTDFNRTFAGSGNAGSPLVIMAETPGGVIFEGRSTITVTGDYVVLEGFLFQNGYPADSKGALILSGDYNRITNCKIDSFNDSVKSETYKWVSLDDDSRGNEVDHCTFTGKASEGALLTIWRDADVINEHHIHHNLFKDFSYNSSDDDKDDSNGWETIRLGTGTWSQYDSSTVVEYNLFSACNGEIEVISNKSGDNTYRYNTFYRNVGHLTLRQGTGCTIYQNYFDTGGIQSAGGIRVCDKNHTIEENYIEGARFSSGTKVRGGIAFMAHYDPTADDPDPLYREVTGVTVRNNSIINSMRSLVFGGGGNDSELQAPSDADFEGNLIRNNINGDGEYDLITVWYDRDMADRSFSGDVFYGSDLGITTPAGILTDKPSLSLNSHGQYMAADGSTGAPALLYLTESDVGVNF
ncbi:MAG: polysaccharide lyase 6 family protein [Spirochaetales bacterium]|nr:polysaccharide lyase 6 family protein [Spirochaetales bacterium]